MSTDEKQTDVRLYAVSSTWLPGHERIVAARTAGAAKYQTWLDICDSWDDMPITAMRARRVRDYVEPSGFRDCMERRGVPFARIGMRVRLDDGREGVIVGHNDSSNLDVLMDGVGVVYNCHPGWQIAYLTPDGERRAPGASIAPAPERAP